MIEGVSPGFVDVEDRAGLADADLDIKLAGRKLQLMPTWPYNEFTQRFYDIVVDGSRVA